MINFQAYKNKNIIILGLGIEGISTLKYLRKLFPNKLITLADQKTEVQLQKDLQTIINNDHQLTLHLGKGYQNNLKHYDIIFKSPGIRLQRPTTAKVTSQTELFLESYRNKIIGITGTKGKTTTSSLIYKILKDAKLDVQLIGNIGRPPFDVLDKISNATYLAFELSSFQLADLRISPHISVFLNLYSEHLDFHKTFKNYQMAKANITLWQNEDDYLIYNRDSAQIAKIIKDLKSKKIPFSLQKKLQVGAYIQNGNAFYNRKKVLKTKDTKLLGEFNLNNILAAISVAKILKIENQSIANSVKTFQPIKDRLQYIGKFRQIHFYNDSIATIPQATIAAIDSLKPDVNTLIAGGYDRGINYYSLSKKIIDEKIPHLILFPDTGKIILAGIKNQKKFQPKHFFANNMLEAVKIAYNVTQKNKICILSPASSSFNMFKNYEDRGRQFINAVKKLK